MSPRFLPLVYHVLYNTSSSPIVSRQEVGIWWHRIPVTMLHYMAQGICRCNWGPSSVDFELVKRETILDRPDLISWVLKRDKMQPQSLSCRPGRKQTTLLWLPKESAMCSDLRAAFITVSSPCHQGKGGPNVILFLFVVVVQSLNHVQLFMTPWTAACQASLSFTIYRSLLKTQVHWVCDASQLSHPLSPPSPPALNLSQWVSSSHQVAKVLELQLQRQSFQWIFKVDFL